MRPPSTTLTSLELRNFRRFSDVEVQFEPDLTVLVAENGGGKTALLDGAAIAIRCLADELQGKAGRGFESADVRLVQAPSGGMVAMSPTVFTCRATVEGTETHWRRELVSVHKKSSSSLNFMKRAAKRLLDDLQASAAGGTSAPPDLPVLAYFGTGRLWSEHRDTKGKKSAAKDQTLQTNAYMDAMSASSSYVHFTQWFESIVREAQNESVTEIRSPHRPVLARDAVRRAVDIVLRPSQWHSLDWDFVAQQVVASHPVHGRLSVGQLSDGIRNLIALVADLAHRAVRLNPHLRERACELSPGIVLIDEVDMHLHPAWQQVIVALLREAFPRLQFIMTTHSPLVISTVSRRSIRILTTEGTVRTPPSETEGFDGMFALQTVFGVDSAPPGPFAEKLLGYRRLIEDNEGNGDRAIQLRDELVDHFGAQHPAIVATTSLKRLQDFKNARKP